MEIKIIRENDEVRACLIGRMDTPASMEVAPQMSALTEDASGTIVLDCTELTYIASSGLRLFLSLLQAANEKGGKVIVRNISNEIRNIFLVTGFLNLFEIQ